MNIGGLRLRPNDPLPVTGFRSRDMAVEGLKKLAENLDVQLPDLDTYLPHRAFQGGGELLRKARNIMSTLTSSAYCRIVDKGPGLIWGFCQCFVWQTLWLRANAYWAGGGYTSWHVPHPDSTAHTSLCGSWCHDADGLLYSG